MPQEVYIASIVFFLISIIGLMTSLQIMLNPMSYIKGSTVTSGLNVREVASKDQAVFNVIQFLFRSIGGLMLGVNFLTLIISLTFFRQLQQWAWIAMWYWPLISLWNILYYKRGLMFWYIQLFWLIVTTAVLIWTYSYFF